jgi:TRAP-type mannitol/chloroaromatic compound transport system permease small subunit
MHYCRVNWCSAPKSIAAVLSTTAPPHALQIRRPRARHRLPAVTIAPIVFAGFLWPIRLTMRVLLAIADLIDRLNDACGRVLPWAVLAAVLLAVGNALARKFDAGSNALLEAQWYLVSAVFLLGAGRVLKLDEHVRIDLLTSRLGPRGRLWADIAGLLTMVLPVAALMLWLSWPWFVTAWTSHEVSASAGGLPLWPARLLVPVGFALLAAQAIALLIRRVAALSEMTR